MGFALAAAYALITGSPTFPKSSWQDVGACLVVGIDGTRLDPQTRAALRDGRIAGIILLGQNIRSVNQVQALAHAAQKATIGGGQPPPLICVDQEGGNVNRLRALAGFPKDPSAAIQSRWSLSRIQAHAESIARFCRQLGINVDFAPVVDLDAGSGIIGSRSFGANPNHVSDCAEAVIRGFAAAGLRSVIKHFPGHGLTHADSHLGLPSMAPSEASRLKHEEPFTRTMTANPDGAMVGHLLLTNVDSRYPASLSPLHVARLRQIVGPNRLIFTDSGSMNALQRYGSEASRAARALSAGVNVYLTTSSLSNLGHDFDQAVFAKISSTHTVELASQTNRRWRLTKLSHDWPSPRDIQSK